MNMSSMMYIIEQYILNITAYVTPTYFLALHYRVRIQLLNVNLLIFKQLFILAKIMVNEYHIYGTVYVFWIILSIKF